MNKRSAIITIVAAVLAYVGIIVWAFSFNIWLGIALAAWPFLAVIAGLVLGNAIRIADRRTKRSPALPDSRMDAPSHNRTPQ